MTSDPTEPDRPSDAPPGTIDLPLPSATGGASSAPFMSPAASSSSVFSPGPTDPPMGAGAPTSGAPADDEDDGNARPPRLVGHRRQRLVVVGIALTAAISLMAITLLYYRWATKAEPTAAIVVWASGGDPAWDGAVVTVRGGGLGAPLKGVVRSEDNMMVRFHVPPGDYVVRVETAGGRLLGQRQNAMQQPLRAGSIWWPFRAPPAATQVGVP